MNPLIRKLSNDPDFAEIGHWPKIQTDIRYACTNNFMSKNVYGDFTKIFLHRIAAEKLKKAVNNLEKEKPEWKFLVFDGLRPATAHLELWKFVEGTPQEIYVANPAKGSLHSFGFAIDLSLVNENGREVDMGTEFDSFAIEAQPRYEAEMVEKGKLTNEQVSNRLILRGIMESAGFKQLSFEWWHYDAENADTVRSSYPIIDYP